jgi:uncharacterized protein YndB with AHSA1/START domain
VSAGGRRSVGRTCDHSNAGSNAVLVEAQVPINGPRERIWSAITDIEHAADIVSGIEQIEIVERPASGLVGLRWRETRILFGKPATVEKRITGAVEGESYSTSAESDGFVFLTTMRITEGGDGITLGSAHDSRPQTIAARIQSIPMGLFFTGMIRKAILQDLHDIKATVERA